MAFLLCLLIAVLIVFIIEAYDIKKYGKKSLLKWLPILLIAVLGVISIEPIIEIIVLWPVLFLLYLIIELVVWTVRAYKESLVYGIMLTALGVASFFPLGYFVYILFM